MKKSILLLSVLLVLTGIVFAQSIEVKSPAPNATLFKGETVTISWKNIGCSSANVKINIFKNSIIQANFVLQLTGNNTESKKWYIPDNFQEGKYILRIKADPAQTGCVGDSEVFNIKKKNNLSTTFNPPKLYKKPGVDVVKLKGNIAITSPVKNGSYEVNKPMNISWNKNLGANSKVNIYLCTETDDQGEKIFSETTNNGNVQWIPPSDKISWPGNRPYIKIVTPNNFYSGKSGLFSIVPPQVTPPHQPIKKTLILHPSFNNNQTSDVGGYPNTECLSTQFPTPGRTPGQGELKTGHFQQGGKSGKCYWHANYKFFSELGFNISSVKGKEILKAEISIVLNEHIMQGPTGTLGTNEFCNSQSRIFEGNTHIKSFSIFSTGEKATIDLLDSVKSWAGSSQSGKYNLVIKGSMDNVNNATSVCLRYYSTPLLKIEYMD